MPRFNQLLAAAVAAATSVVAADPFVTSLLMPFQDPHPFVATVLNVDASATTFAFICPSDVDPDVCGMTTHGTIVQGPSTWRMTLSDSGTGGLFASTAACVLTSSKDIASCTVAVTVSNSDTQTSSMTTGMTTSWLSDQQAVTLIAGLDKLTDGAVPKPSTASPTPTPSASSSRPQNSGGASPSSTAAVSTPGASSASGSKTATANAAPAATQQVLLAGVAAVVGAFAL